MFIFFSFVARKRKENEPKEKKHAIVYYSLRLFLIEPQTALCPSPYPLPIGARD